MSKPRLRLLSVTTPLLLDATDGRRTLGNATGIFRYIDHNFTRWNCNVTGRPSENSAVNVYEMVQDSTLLALFCDLGVSLDSLALTQAQIIEFVELYPGWLKEGGNGTFFLFKVRQEFFVAVIYLFSDRRLGVRVRHLHLERVFRAQKRHRLVAKAIERANRPN